MEFKEGVKVALSELKAELRIELKTELRVELKEELKEEMKEEMKIISYNAAHALTRASDMKINGGAFFSVLDQSNGKGIFCGFFVDARIALTINHDDMFTGPLLPETVHAVSASGQALEFSVASTHKDLDFTVLRLTSDEREDPSSFFSLQGFAEITSGLSVSLVTMGIGSRGAIQKDEPAAAATISADPRKAPYTVHRATINSYDASHILYDGAETWAGDSGGALLIEDGFVIGMHQEVIDSSDFQYAAPHAGGERRKRSAPITVDDVAAALEKVSVASSSHGKVRRALRLTNPKVLAAVALARSSGGGAGAAAGASAGGGQS